MGMLSITLSALGNRAWGSAEGGRLKGVIIMTLALIISHPVVLAIPFYAAGVYLWRIMSPRPWMHIPQNKGTWGAGFKRGLWVMPLAVILAVATHNPIHLLLGAIAVFAVPAAYWLGFKYKKQPGEMAELLAGAVVGAI